MSSKTAVVTGPIVGGAWVNRTPSAVSRSYSACTSSTPNDVNGMPSSTSAALNGPAGGCPSGSSSELDAVGGVGETTVSQRCSPSRDLGLLHEAEHVGVEGQRLVLVVDEDAGDVMLMVLLWLAWSSARRSGRAAGVEVVELVAALAARAHQAGVLEHVEVLRDGLP